MKRASNHITRGTLPNPILMFPVSLFSPACLRSPEPSRPTHFDLPRKSPRRYPTLHYNRAPTFVLPFDPPSPPLIPFRFALSGDPDESSGAWVRRIINRVPLSATNREITSISLMGKRLREFSLIKRESDKCSSSSYSSISKCRIQFL